MSKTDNFSVDNVSFKSLYGAHPICCHIKEHLALLPAHLEGST